MLLHEITLYWAKILYQAIVDLACSSQSMTQYRSDSGRLATSLSLECQLWICLIMQKTRLASRLCGHTCHSEFCTCTNLVRVCVCCCIIEGLPRPWYLTPCKSKNDAMRASMICHSFFHAFEVSPASTSWRYSAPKSARAGLRCWWNESKYGSHSRVWVLAAFVVPLPENKNINCPFHIFDRYEIHIQTFGDAFYEQFSFSDPHLHKIDISKWNNINNP